MRAPLDHSVQRRLLAFEQQIRKRDLLVTIGYSLALAGAVILYAYFPFELSRVGSVILVIALGHMIWKVYDARRQGFQEMLPEHEMLLTGELTRLEAQIRLIQGLIYNLPFLAGANLFFMGLPGTGSAESKAWLDCYFLLGTVIVFGALYVANQHRVRTQLIPLKQELERFVLADEERF